ncbi:hypothetical protein F0562_023454 [Nyssa sinensis]|uniref:Transmembrane protein n=1 Tax=Nyssa sinensis TaxID=561372 RepID=A0A5J5BJG9_9ASTE|nr:hypothetical protein F0562_023454 [Nyssa sinensis]
MARNHNLASQFTPLLRSQPQLLSLTTVFCPLILSLSTLVLLFFLTMKPFMTFTEDHWTLKGLLIPSFTGYFFFNGLSPL